MTEWIQQREVKDEEITTELKSEESNPKWPVVPRLFSEGEIPKTKGPEAKDGPSPSAPQTRYIFWRREWQKP